MTVYAFRGNVQCASNKIENKKLRIYSKSLVYYYPMYFSKADLMSEAKLSGQSISMNLKNERQA